MWGQRGALPASALGCEAGLWRGGTHHGDSPALHRCDAIVEAGVVLRLGFLQGQQRRCEVGGAVPALARVPTHVRDTDGTARGVAMCGAAAGCPRDRARSSHDRPQAASGARRTFSVTGALRYAPMVSLASRRSQRLRASDGQGAADPPGTASNGLAVSAACTRRDSSRCARAGRRTAAQHRPRHTLAPCRGARGVQAVCRKGPQHVRARRTSPRCSSPQMRRGPQSCTH